MIHIDIYTERLSVSFLIALITHLGGIYGVGFLLPKITAHPLMPTMEVILVQKKTETSPQHADYLAQATQEGGGEAIPKRERPATPTFAPFPSPIPELVAMPPPPQIATGALDPQIKQLTGFQAHSFQIEQFFEPRTTSDEELSQGEAEETSPLDEESPLKVEISNLYSQVDSLQAELRRKVETYAKHPRKKYVSANTREYKYANY